MKEREARAPSGSKDGTRPTKSRSTSRAPSQRSGSRQKSTPREPTPRRRSSSRRSTHSSRSGNTRRGYSPASRRSTSRRRRSTSRRRSVHRSRSTSRRRTRTRSPRDYSRRRRSRSRSRSRSDRRSGSRRPAQRRAPSPRSLRADQQSARDAAHALDAQYPAMGSSKGIYLPRSRATLEPYKNLPPDIKRRAGERRSRRDLSLPEHLCGILFMSLKAMDPHTDVYAAVEHAAQVAQDAATIQWPTVRTWSQACLSHLESSGSSWLDAHVFKDERMRLCWCKEKSQPDIQIPCPQFNTDTCPDRNSHSSEGRTWLHSCGVCYYGINDVKNDHPSQRCRKRSGLKLVGEDSRQDNRRRFNNNPLGQKRDDKSDRAKPKN